MTIMLFVDSIYFLLLFKWTFIYFYKGCNDKVKHFYF